VYLKVIFSKNHEEAMMELDGAVMMVPENLMGRVDEVK
jgi:hypothetical protein